MVTKRNSRKKKVNNENGLFRLNYGTHNRHEPNVIFISGKTWVKPTHNNIPKIIDKINSLGRREINKLVNGDNVFIKNKLIFDINIATNHMLKNKKSLLSFDLYLVQKDVLDFNDKRLEEEVSTLSNQITNLITEKIGNDVILSKQK